MALCSESDHSKRDEKALTFHFIRRVSNYCCCPSCLSLKMPFLSAHVLFQWKFWNFSLITGDVFITNQMLPSYFYNMLCWPYVKWNFIVIKWRLKTSSIVDSTRQTTNNSNLDKLFKQRRIQKDFHRLCFFLLTLLTILCSWQTILNYEKYVASRDFI